MSTTFLGSVPQQFIMWTATRSSSRPSPSAMSTAPFRRLWGLFINYFNRFGRQWQVYIEAGATTERKPKTWGNFMSGNQNGGWFALRPD